MSVHDIGEHHDADSGGPAGDDLRAAEYALGVLERDERVQARKRVHDDRAFAEAVAGWERRLSAWRGYFPRLAPPPQVWKDVCDALDLAVAPEIDSSWWNRAAPWRVAAGLAAAIALVAIVKPFIGPPGTLVKRDVAIAPPAAEEVAKPVAVLRRADGSVGWLASLDRASGKVLMVPVPTPADPGGKVDELWLRDGRGVPVSLGFVSNEKAHTIVVPAAALDRLAVGSVLSVSLEDKAGIPHASQSDRLVAAGPIETM